MYGILKTKIEKVFKTSTRYIMRLLFFFQILVCDNLFWHKRILI